MIKEIPYRSLPKQSSLFLHYLEKSPKALQFFQTPPGIENLNTDLRENIIRHQFPRSAIVSILRRQNETYDCSTETLERIDDLAHPDCVAILTGQQVGLFTGPLYTIYKALTAIHLSEQLRNRGIRAVPIFWMETEDHDLAEVLHQTVLMQDNTGQTIDYGSVLFENCSDSIHPVGSIQFPETIREVVQNFSNCLPSSEWKHEIQSMLESTYQPGSTFTLSFARLLQKILHGSGLILFDPRDHETKPLSSHIFRWALENSDAIHELLIKRNSELEAAGYHPQVHVSDNSTALFIIENGERRALEKQNSGFCLKNGEQTYSLSKLLGCTEKTPEKFSPNVLLRPLIQDTLFPTLAYIGGPSEVAYFAQIEVLYSFLGHPMPVIWPRDSFTLMEAEIRKAMLRLGIEIEDCFEGIHFLQEKALHNHRGGIAGSRFLDLKKHLEKTFSEIRPDAEILDPSLPQALDTAQRKILHNIERLKSRVIHIEGNRNSSILNAAGLLLNHCLPNRNLQERELSILYFLALRGPTVLDAIRSGIQTSEFFHHVIQLE